MARDRAAIQKLTEERRQSTLGAFERYVANRQKTVSLFERLDPHSHQTRDARSLLERAISQRDAYTTSIKTPHEQQPGVEA
jgi:hypothetical protein